MKPFNAEIDGLVWRVAFRPLSAWGSCSSPFEPHREIVIHSELLHPDNEFLLLATANHEFLHDSQWLIDEEYVRRYAEDQARLLWKLGFRRKDD